MDRRCVRRGPVRPYDAAVQHVLVVEDDRDVAVPLASFFTAMGFDAAVVDHGQEALSHVADVATDVVILDLMLPDLDGVDVCSILRDRGFDGGIIMMSARDQEVDVVAGLDAGADDYLAKPCSVAELQARVRSVIRRTTGTYDVSDGVGRDGLDVRDHRITYAGAEVATSGREYEVLARLVEHRGRVVRSAALMDEVWGPDWSGSPVVLSSAVGRIRQRLASVGAQDRVEAVRGVGFRLSHSSRS